MLRCGGGILNLSVTTAGVKRTSLPIRAAFTYVYTLPCSSVAFGHELRPNGGAGFSFYYIDWVQSGVERSEGLEISLPSATDALRYKYSLNVCL